MSAVNSDDNNDNNTNNNHNGTVTKAKQTKATTAGKNYSPDLCDTQGSKRKLIILKCYLGDLVTASVV
jgi:hypothetical protein